MIIYKVCVWVTNLTYHYFLLDLIASVDSLQGFYNSNPLLSPLLLAFADPFV